MSDSIEDLISSRENDGDSGWFRLDEFKDVQVSLKSLNDALVKVSADSSYWKQAILACHSALQGACVCILTRTDGTGALAQKTEKQLMNKLYGESGNGQNIDDDSVDWPEEFIAALPELLNRLPDPLAINLPRRKAARYPFDRAGDMRRLHEFRNTLVHFPSTSWSVAIVGLPRILLGAIDLTEEITTSDEYPRRNRFLEMNLAPLFEEIRKKLQEIERSQQV